MKISRKNRSDLLFYIIFLTYHHQIPFPKLVFMVLFDGQVWDNLLFLSAKNAVPSLSTNHSSTSLRMSPMTSSLPMWVAATPGASKRLWCDLRQGDCYKDEHRTWSHFSKLCSLVVCSLDCGHHWIPWFSLYCFHYWTASPSTHHPRCKMWSFKVIWKELTEIWNDQSWTYQVKKT